MVQIRQESPVLVGRSDGDPDPFWKLVLVHRSNNHPSFQQVPEYLFPIPNVEEDKICHTRHVLKFSIAEFGLKKFAPLPDHLSRFHLVLVVPETGECASLCDGIYVERLPGFLQKPNKIFVCQAVTNSKTGQSLNLRKRPKNNYVRMVAEILRACWADPEEIRNRPRPTR